MTPVLFDCSVLVKWFHSERETEVAEAVALLRAHRRGAIQARILDLGLYEFGNILVRSLRWSATDVADQLDELLLICGPALTLEAAWRRDAAELAEKHHLSYYDAAYAGAARGLQMPLVSADRQLLRAGLAESATEIVARLRLPRS